MTAHSTHLVLVPGLGCTEDLFAEQVATLRGKVAISVADHTRHDTRLALLDTSALSDTPEQSERRLKLIAMAQTGEYKSVRDTLWPLFVHPARHDDAVLKRAVFKMMDDTGPETFICQQKAIMSRPDSRPSRGAIHCPTLVLVGNEDALTPVSVALTIAEGIAGSKLDIVQDCGHLSTMERPDAVTEALRAWIAR
jgi:pimeloyl-ACP methyl ester carboxylesterase